MKNKLFIFVCLILCFFSGQSFADYIFNDDFNSENSGNYKLSYADFTNWTVSDGTVDLIGNGHYDFQPGYGLYIDMDGSSGNAGKITTVLTNLNAGTYKLEFDLAGNQRDNTQTEQVNLTVFGNKGNLLINNSYIYTPGHQYDPFTTYTAFFTLVNSGDIPISFEGIGGDNIGMLLDNIRVSLVPVPATILLGFLGLGVGGWKLRKSLA